MKGFGTDEKELIRVLATKDPLQVEAIRTTFDKTFKRSLLEDIKDETRGYFEAGLIQLARGPLLNDVFELFEAMDGMGTKEVVLDDVLLGRSNADIQAIKGAYQRTLRRRLEDSLKSDLSGKVERHFMLVLAANRAEDSAPVIPQQVDDDVMNIYRATEGKVGTDEVLISSIFTGRNDNQLRAIAHTYKQKFHKDLEDVIKSVRLRCIASSKSTMFADTQFRNFRAIWRMPCSSSCAMPSISTWPQRSALKKLWPELERRTSCSWPASSAITGIVMPCRTSRRLISSATIRALPAG